MRRKIGVALVAFAISGQPLFCAQTVSSALRSQKHAVLVPFVGCKSDGQVGPQEAPHEQSKAVWIPADASERLAYYQAAYGFGVLAPRGWHCFGTYGSSGSTLYVSPEPINSTELFSSSWKGFSGPAIQISVEDGDTSGRFGVAQVIARVFPTYKSFVKSVIAEGIEPASSFPFGPYPDDKLTYRDKETVEFETPASTDGLGTASRLRKNSNPVRGVAILFGEDSSLAQLSLRLPSGANDLTALIIRQVERDATQQNH